MGNSDQRRQMKSKRYLNGLCVYCGKKKFLNGKKGCKACLKKKYEITKRFYKKHPEKQSEYRRKIRRLVLEKYGGKCDCKNCKEVRWQFLTIDHKNRDGASERKKLYGSTDGQSHPWYLKLKREPKRNDLRILCYNCNNAAWIFGACPHDEETTGSRKI